LPAEQALDITTSSLYEAWGKLSRDKLGRLTGEHPLLDHMTDVAACFLALAECTSIRRLLEKRQIVISMQRICSGWLC